MTREEEMKNKDNNNKEYEKDLNKLKERILKDGDTLLTKRDLLERFCEVDKEYNGSPWNLLQILTNINILIGEEFCEDCVSRKSLKHKLQERHDFFVDAYGGFINLPQKDKARVDAIATCIAMVVNEPPVKPARKKGKWIDRWDKILLCEDKNCSICGFLSQTTYNYCPNCGAEMESEE